MSRLGPFVSGFAIVNSAVRLNPSSPLLPRDVKAFVMLLQSCRACKIQTF